MNKIRILVLGAAGRTGRLVVAELLKQGYENITCLIHNPSKLELFDDNRLSVVVGDATSELLVHRICQGQDIIIDCICPSRRLRQQKVVEALLRQLKNNSHVNYIFISTLGVGNSYNQLPIGTKLLMSTMLRGVIRDKHRCELLLHESKVKWAIVRPGPLTDHHPTADFVLQKSPGGAFKATSRNNLAHALVKVANSIDGYIGHTWELADAK